MSHGMTRAVPLAGIALGCAAAAALVMMGTGGSSHDASRGSEYVVLPQGSTAAYRANPVILATPGPTDRSEAPPTGSAAGIWSTPAEFAPPE